MAPDVWAFYEELGESDRSGLSPLHAQIAAICDLRHEVRYGGFDEYFRYTAGDTAPVALEGLKTLLGPTWAQLLDDAMRLFGETYPLSEEAREEIIDNTDETVIDFDLEFEALYMRLHELEMSGNADAVLNAALRH
jgi:hypothetical protein